MDSKLKLRECAVKGCGYKAAKGFRTLPGDKELSKRWIEILSLEKVTSSTLVCDGHFHKDDKLKVKMKSSFVFA